MSKRWNINDPKVRELIRQRAATQLELPDQAEEAKEDKRRIKAMPVAADDYRNPYGVYFPSTGEMNFRIRLDLMGIKYEPSKVFKFQASDYTDGVTLKPYRITIDFFLPGLNVLVDYKGRDKVTERARWQFRLLALYLSLTMPKKEVPYICTVTPTNSGQFLAIANTGNRDLLRPFIYDLKSAL